MKNNKLYYNYWGKASKSKGKAPENEDHTPEFHLLVYHSLDVAAVGYTFLNEHPLVHNKLSSLTGLKQDKFLNWFSFFIALHDLGKFAQSFQNLNFKAAQKLDPSPNRCLSYKEKHDVLGWRLWHKHLKNEAQHITSAPMLGGWAAVEQLDDPIDFFINSVTGHHGKPPDKKSSCRSLNDDFTQKDKAAALEFLNDLIKVFDLQGQSFPNLQLEQVKRASWWLNGVAVLSDWLGSNTQYFPYCTQIMPLQEYWQTAQQKARKAVDQVEMIKSKPAEKFNLHNMLNKAQPSPLQKVCAEWPIHPVPHLFILEDATGSGKTEAAILLAHKLMQAGLGTGVFFALPTMATSNAMYERIKNFYQHMFKTKPSLVLAHSKRHMVDIFKNSSSFSKQEAGYSLGETTASAHCNNWLLDNRKKSLLADVGVGTLDQALLSILPSKHQALRLLGLMNKVIIVDEVHACDSYMHTLLCKLLEAQAQINGSVILLSATLPQNQKQKLIQSYEKFYSKTAKPQALVNRAGETSAQPSPIEYPLITSFRGEELQEKHVKARKEASRTLNIKFLNQEGADLNENSPVFELIQKSVRSNNCVCWIRNTVYDAIEAYKKIKSFNISSKVELFHSRYALCDRLTIEQSTLQNFGKNSTTNERGGRVLIATQVVEQSLDLDFDVLISDLAPIDLLLQRAGRLQRHIRDKVGNPIVGPDQRSPACLYIYGPTFVKDAPANWYKKIFPKAAYVYPDHGQLWLTAYRLQNNSPLQIPSGLRHLIEGVYSESAQQDIPENLKKSSVEAQGQAMASSCHAQMQALDLTTGYKKSGDFWWDEGRTTTRLGQPSTSLYLARWDGHQLLPWASDFLDSAPWFMSSLMLRSYLANKQADHPDISQSALEACKQNLPGAGEWSLVLPLVQHNNRWIGKTIGQAQDQKETQHIWEYSPTLGLVENKV